MGWSTGFVTAMKNDRYPDRAFQWLESAYRDRRHRLIYLKSDPAWDPIRSEPRFADLVARIGLAQTAAST